MASLSSTGLFLATAASVGNVGFDVAAKRALGGNSFLHNTLRIRALVALLLTVVLAGLWFHTSTRSSLSLFRLGFYGLAHEGILPVLLLSTGLVTAAILLYYRSLQVAPLSVTAPLFGLTPVFLLAAGFLIFRQIPTLRLVAGVVCILFGSILAHWTPSRRSFTAACSHFLREKGIAPMLGACVLLSITNLLDRWLVLRLDVLSYAWLYVVLCALFTWVLVLVVRPAPLLAQSPRGWIALAGFIDTVVLLLHFASLQYVDAVVTIAIKRSGMLLSVIAGAYFFQERNGRQRLAAAFVVMMGVLTMYFDLSSWGLALVFGAGAASAVTAFLAARPKHEPETVPDAVLRPSLP